VREEGNPNLEGVKQDRETGKWTAYATLKGKQIYIGEFDTSDEAIQAWNLRVNGPSILDRMKANV
jgi:hypothetical protein